jgi:hypothetical protein
MMVRVERAVRIALGEEDFVRVLGAAAALILTGILTFWLAQDWSLVDSLYVAVATLTTSSILDPELTITDKWLKLFTAGYVLLGIGILVEVARRRGMAFIAARAKVAAEQQAEARLSAQQPCVPRSKSRLSTPRWRFTGAPLPERHCTLNLCVSSASNGATRPTNVNENDSFPLGTNRAQPGFIGASGTPSMTTRKSTGAPLTVTLTMAVTWWSEHRVSAKPGTFRHSVPDVVAAVVVQTAD